MKKLAIAVGAVGCAVAAAMTIDQTPQAPPLPELAVTPVSPTVPPAAAPLVSPSDPVYRQIGVVTPRSAAQLRAAGNITSLFSIGAETTDRNFSTYANWQDKLGPLGIPAARVQTGWTDIEKIKGKYDYEKLDAIIRGMKAQGVQPWLSLVYGNMLYEGGGTNGLGGGYPRAATPGRAAWKAFVTDIVKHYNTPELKVTEWEIWNEPDEAWDPDVPDAQQAGKTPEDFAGFAIETARAIKAQQSEAKLLLGGFLRIFTGRRAFVTRAVQQFYNETKDTIQSEDVSINFHPYTENPDTVYFSPTLKKEPYDYAELKKLATQTGYRLRQGENGAPSARSPFAIGYQDWTESGQAKFALRRLLNDFWEGYQSNLFTIVDLHYNNALNPKGLLRTRSFSAYTPPTNGDQTVVGQKLAYGAVQALAAIFDSRLERLKSPGCVMPYGYTVQAYSRLDPGNVRRNMLVVWRNIQRPGENETVEDINFTCNGFDFPRYRSLGYRPRYTDLVYGRVYELLDSNTAVLSGTAQAPYLRVTGLRVSDGPVILADQGVVPVTPQ